MKARRAVLTLAGFAALLAALVTPAAGDTLANRFNAAVVPSAVQPLSTVSYGVQLMNRTQSDAAANNAHVAVPVGFAVDPLSVAATTTAAGACSAATWVASLNLVTSTIDAVAPDATSELCPGARLTVTFGATAPLGEGTYTWTSTLFHDSSSFGLQGGQPTVTVDGTPPAAPTLTAEPSDPSNDPAPSFGFSDDDETATFLCRLDGGAAAACTSPQSYSGLAEGSHTFAVQAVDPAGNASSSTSYTWTIDLTPVPTPTITSGPPDVTASTDASFAFTDDDASATFQCGLDGAAFAACTSPVSYGDLGEGGHTFRVKAVDTAGTESSVATYSWTIDLTPPPLPTISSAPPEVTDATSATFAFIDDDASATFRCQLDDGTFAPCTSPNTYEQLSEGEHTFRVKAVDPVGNEGAVASFTWAIDLTNPVVTIDQASEPGDPTNVTGARLVFTSNKVGSTFECRLDGSSFSSCSSPATYGGLADGRHSFAVRATDSLGRVGLPSTYDWTIDTVPPVTTITSGPPTSGNSSSATFAFTGSEAGSVFACSLDGGSFGVCASPKLYADLADGDHVFRVRATDLAGNQEQTPAAYSWQIVTSVPPDVTPPRSVSDFRRIVGYGQLKLVWSLPTDSDFAYVRVLRARSSKAPAETVVYQGNGTSYADKRFQNGTYYRYEIQAYDASGNASPLVQAVVRPSTLLRAPRDGGVVKAPPLLLWTGVPRASYYNVQVYRGGQKVLSAWPSRAKQKLHGKWVYQGRSFHLRKGGYRWWVWPAFGPRSKAAYGQLLGTGTFTVR